MFTIKQMSITKYQIESQHSIGPQTKHELETLLTQLKPYLQEYERSRTSIASVYSRWRSGASSTAKKYADLFIEDIGISKGYLSKLKKIELFRKEKLLDEPREFNDWFEQQPITSQYYLTKTSFIDVVNLWDSGQKVSRETAKALARHYENLNMKPKPEPTNPKAGLIPGIDQNRKEFLEKQIINNDSFPLLNNLRLANYWSGMSHDELLTLVEQRLMISEDKGKDSFRGRLKALLGTSNEGLEEAVEVASISCPRIHHLPKSMHV